VRHPFSLPLFSLALAAFSIPACLAIPIASGTCPVELSATQRGAGQLAAAGSAPSRMGPPQQAIDLSLRNTRLQRIVAVNLQVHGTANKARTVAVNSSVGLDIQPVADAVRSVHLESSVPADQSRTSTVAIKGLTSVSWISITELRYADGATWSAGPGRTCDVRPDGMMLIAGK